MKTERKKSVKSKRKSNRNQSRGAENPLRKTPTDSNVKIFHGKRFS